MTISDTHRFYLDIPNQGRVQVYPLNSELRWIDEQKKGYRFYQKTLGGSLIFKDIPKDDIFDFQTLMDLERQGKTCERVEVVIDKYCPCNESWTEEYYKGYLRLSKGKWNVSDCEVSIPVEVNDAYTCLTTEWDKDLDIFDYGDPPIEVTPFYGVLIQIQCQYTHTLVFDPIPSFETMVAQVRQYMFNNPADDCINAGEGWTPIKTTYKATMELKHSGLFQQNLSMHVHMTVRRQYAREIAFDLTEPPGGGWIGNPGPPWYRAINVTGEPYLDHTTPEGVAALIAEWGSDDIHIGYIQRNLIVGLDSNNQSILTNGKELGPVLEDWIEMCDLTIVSNFLNINPDGTAPANDYYTRAEQDAYGLVVFQITDVARTDETESATIAITSFKKIMQMFKVVFNLDMEIEGDILRIEHQSYWPDAVGMDLTLPQFEKWILGKWNYTYEQDKLPKREFFRWGIESDALGGDFDGYPIEYDNNCVNDMDKPLEDENRAEQFISNIKFVVNNEDFYDSDMLLLVSTTEGVINYALQPISGRNTLNGNLALGYLIPRYHDHSRPFKTGFINKVQTALYLSLRVRNQVDITIPMQCDDYMNNYDAAELVKTQMGAGQIKKATYLEPAGQLTLSLIHK